MMAVRSRTTVISRSLVLFIIGFIASLSESADVSRCPSQLPRTPSLKASDWDKCYVFHVEERQWRSANYVCAAKGGHLVTIKEERVQKFLLKSLSELRWPRNGIWIGATDKQKEMEWIWVTGERVQDGYSNWASGQPSCRFLCIEDCAVMRWKENGKWSDYHCSWLEDYSFICEYDMLPLPKTTLQSTTTTTTSTTRTSISTTAFIRTESADNSVGDQTNATIFVLDSSSSKILKSDYYLQGHKGHEDEKKKGVSDREKNNSDAMIPPEVLLYGKDGARAEQVQDNVSSSLSSLGSGSIAYIVIAILVILVVGLCFVLIFVRRRHRKLIREDDNGISYENPYYESPRTGKGSGNRQENSEDTIGETDDEDTFACDDCQAVAFGFTACAPASKCKEVKQASNNSHCSRFMNDYDTPPTLKKSPPKIYKGKYNEVAYKASPKANPERQTVLVTKEGSVYYDELQPCCANSHSNYDIPRASTQLWYKNDDGDAALSLTDEMYYNHNHEENIYESLENLGDGDEETGVMDDPHTRADDENRYVPFPLDSPNVASEK